MTKPDQITPKDKIAFIAALKNGMGLTLSASFILRHPKEISEIIKSDKALHTECIEAIKHAAKILLVISNEHLEKRRFAKWFSNNIFLRQFRTELVFWSDRGIGTDMNNQEIITAYYRYNDIADCSTSICMLQSELMDKIINTPSS